MGIGLAGAAAEVGPNVRDGAGGREGTSKTQGGACLPVRDPQVVNAVATLKDSRADEFSYREHEHAVMAMLANAVPRDRPRRQA